MSRATSRRHSKGTTAKGTTVKRARGGRSHGRGFPVWALIIAAVVVAGVLAVVLTSQGDDGSGSASDETADVDISGDPLARFENQTEDPAIGETAPTLSGSNFAGEPVTLAADDGNAKAIFFVAHWCPHCQEEIPRLAGWLASNDAPEGLDIEIVSTAVDDRRPNFPPSSWLEREGVGDLPTIADDADGGAHLAYGAGGFPFVVYLDAENRVVLRTEGEYPDDPGVYTELFEGLAAGEPITDPRRG
jgi:thiol-disulfide isomerase/thioredoxin